MKTQHIEFIRHRKRNAKKQSYSYKYLHKKQKKTVNNLSLQLRETYLNNLENQNKNKLNPNLAKVRT